MKNYTVVYELTVKYGEDSTKDKTINNARGSDLAQYLTQPQTDLLLKAALTSDEGSLSFADHTEVKSVSVKFTKLYEIAYLDYKISMSGDGICLVDKHGCNAMPGAMDFGKVWDQKSLDSAKHSATILFMIARPEKFDGALYYRLTGTGGAYHEYYTLKSAIEEEGLEMPAELSGPVDGMNLSIGFKGKKI
jgi:hypothetical protein